MAENNTKINGFPFSHIGTSKTRSYEDRGYFGSFITNGGLDLTIAIVSDGVGGGNLGQRAAELTVEVIKENIKESNKQENEITQILGAAVGAANKAVYQESRTEKDKYGMSATMSIAVICNSRLYVANVGDSRVYLIKDGKAAKQITLDHTFAYQKIKQGVSPEKAYSHPSADSITRSVGFEANIIVDLGLYLNEGQEDGQQAFSNQGMQLNKNDVILVCTDGLIKEAREDKKRHYVEQFEIVEIIKKYHAEEAAKVMVNLAVERYVDDNVTVVVMEFVGRKITTMTLQRKIILGTALLLILFIIALFRLI